MICAVSAKNKSELKSITGVKSVVKANDFYYVVVDDEKSKKFVRQLRLYGDNRAIQLDIGAVSPSIWHKIFGMKLFSRWRQILFTRFPEDDS